MRTACICPDNSMGIHPECPLHGFDVDPTGRGGPDAAALGVDVSATRARDALALVDRLTACPSCGSTAGWDGAVCSTCHHEPTAELPGMWEESDLSGGWADSTAERAGDADDVATAMRALADEWQQRLDTPAWDQTARDCWNTAIRELRAALEAPQTRGTP